MADKEAVPNGYQSLNGPGHRNALPHDQTTIGWSDHRERRWPAGSYRFAFLYLTVLQEPIRVGAWA
jgi:hypothetical protein